MKHRQYSEMNIRVFNCHEIPQKVTNFFKKTGLENFAKLRVKLLLSRKNEAIKKI